MKKLIFVLIMLYSSICFSEIKGFIETGKDIDSNVAYTEMQIGYIFRPFNFIFYPYGNQITWYEIENNRGNPFRDIYTVGADFKYLDLTFNVQHFCSHRVVSDREQNHRYYDVPMGGQMTKISIRYDF